MALADHRRPLLDVAGAQGPADRLQQRALADAVGGDEEGGARVDVEVEVAVGPPVLQGDVGDHDASVRAAQPSSASTTEPPVKARRQGARRGVLGAGEGLVAPALGDDLEPGALAGGVGGGGRRRLAQHVGDVDAGAPGRGSAGSWPGRRSAGRGTWRWRRRRPGRRSAGGAGCGRRRACRCRRGAPRRRRRRPAR